MKNKLLLAAIVSATVAILASLFAGTLVALIPALAAMALRWLAVVLIAAYATYRRSLTAWILIGLLAGAEFGHDAVATAAQLQFLGATFLRVIKVIIARLLFGTLVVGIAGHADLKKEIGRAHV